MDPTSRKNHISNLSYASTDANVELPILDITHPLFIASINENLYRQSNIKSANLVKLLKKLPGFAKAFFTKTSDVENSYLSSMRTYIYKLGPNLTKGIRLGFRDNWAVKQSSFMGLRMRLRDTCSAQAGILIPQLKEHPGKNLCFFNIAGGPASDSINTLFLIQDADSELLKGRKIEINIFDIDAFGPNFAKRCIDILKMPDGRLSGLDVTLKSIPYNWSNPEELTGLLRERSEWIQVCCSEGGLFEYGSGEDIVQNLNRLYTDSADDMKIVGSLIFDKSKVSPGYLGFAELTGIGINFLGLEGLNSILSKTRWVLDSFREIDTIFIVFTLRKSITGD